MQNEKTKWIVETKNVDIAHETLRTFSLTHNYNIWIIELFAPYIGHQILEVGCGMGNLSFYLQHFGDLSCVDISDLYLAHMKIDYPNLHFYQFDIVDERIKSLKDKKFDTIICVNVLEHIENDKKALQNMFEILQPGGRLLLYVPAGRFLYGSIDKNLSHFRRYDKKSLERLLIEVGFKIEKLYFSNFIGMFGWFLNGKIKHQKKLSYWQILLFDKFVPLLKKIEKRFPPNFGLSLVVIGSKINI